MNNPDRSVEGQFFRVTQCPDVSSLSPDDHDPETHPLYKVLFQDSQNSYAVLDAAIVPNLPELLETSGLKFRCLFSGEAEAELGSVAPWLIALERESAFVRNLLMDSDTPAPWHLWGYEPGIFIQSAENFELVWRHLRKFIRVQDEMGKWFLMRFWSTDFLVLLLRQPRADQMPFLQSLLRPGIISAIFGHNVFDEVFKVEVMQRSEASPLPPKPYFYRDLINTLGPALANRRSARDFARDYPALFNDVQMNEIRLRIYHARATATAMRIDAEGLVGTFILLGVVYAPMFWEDQGFLLYWNQSRLQPNSRFKAYLAALKSQTAYDVPEFKAWW